MILDKLREVVLEGIYAKIDTENLIDAQLLASGWFQKNTITEDEYLQILDAIEDKGIEIAERMAAEEQARIEAEQQINLDFAESGLFENEEIFEEINE